MRPQGLLLSDYSLLDKAALPNAIATVSGQPPNDQTKADCPVYSEFPAGAKANSRGIVNASGCIYPVETVSLRRPAGRRTTQMARLHGGDGRRDRPARQLRAARTECGGHAPPGGYAAKLNPFVYFHSLLDLGDCTENDVPLSELEGDLKKIETTANFNYICPNLCNVGISGQCPPGAPTAPPRPTPSSPPGAEILASPAYKKDGLLIVSFGQVNQGAPVDPAVPPPPTRSRSVPWCFRASSRRAPPTPSPMTPTRCCTPSRTSSTSLHLPLPAAAG